MGKKLTKEQKKNREEFAEITKQLDKERGRDRIKYHHVGDPDSGYRSFVIFDGTEISEGGWLIGRKWMTAKYLKSCEARWVKSSYDTRLDEFLKGNLPATAENEKLKEIYKDYGDGGAIQCGGCRWFAALDCDYGFCCNEKSPNEGRITFEHGGCIQHSYIQELLEKKIESKR